LKRQLNTKLWCIRKKNVDETEILETGSVHQFHAKKVSSGLAAEGPFVFILSLQENK
jgi:hypothetical protein